MLLPGGWAGVGGKRGGGTLGGSCCGVLGAYESLSAFGFERTDGGGVGMATCGTVRIVFVAGSFPRLAKSVTLSGSGK